MKFPQRPLRPISRRQSTLQTRANKIALAALAGLTILQNRDALAVDRQWIGLGTGNWNNPGNWLPSTSPPVAGDIADIVHNDAFVRTVNYNYTGTAITLASLLLSNTGAGNTTFVINSNALTTTNATIGSGGTAAINQGGGTFTVNNNFSFVNGFYNLTGGQFTVGNLDYIGDGGTATFTQNGGTHAASNLLDIGINATGVGTYNLQTGTLTSASEDIAVFGGRGTLNQSGGVNTMNSLRVGAFGTGGVGIVNLSGGTLTASTVPLGGFGTATAGVGILNATGGALTASSGITIYNTSIGTNSSGVTINGGTVTTPLISTPDWARLNFIKGTLNLNGGLSSNTGTLTIGNGGALATLNQNGGAIYSAAETVGSGAGITGAVNQNSGSNFVSGSLNIGGGGGGSGTYTLFNGLLSVGVAQVGVGGNGVFIQNSGVFNSASALGIGNSGFSGRYQLIDGSINTSLEDLAYFGANGTLNQSGGTNTMVQLRVASSGTGGIGIVNLSGGMLISPSVVLGGLGTNTGGVGILNATGGTLTASGDIIIYNTSIGTSSSGVTINGGTVNAGFVVTPDWNRVNFNKGTLNLTGTSSNTGTLNIGNGNGGLATLNLNGGRLFASDENVGINTFGVGSGFLNQTGGTHSISGGLIIASGPLSSGTVQLGGGGVINVNGNTDIGQQGTGTFTQSNGTFNANQIFLGTLSSGAGTYNLTGGQAIASDLYVGGWSSGAGGSGNFNANGGTITLSNSLTVFGGKSASLNQSAGTVNVTGTGGVLIGMNGGAANSPGGFNLTGGNFNISDTSSGDLLIGNGIATVSNTANLSIGRHLNVGALPGYTGTLNQTGGTVSIAPGGWGYVGNTAAGGYNLSGGTLSFAGGNGSIFNVGQGVGSSGTMTISGSGNFHPDNLYVGNNGGSGTVRVNGGTVNVNNQTFIGAAGSTGNLAVANGTFNGSWIDVGRDTGSIGTFNLTGGNITLVSELNVGRAGGTGTANISGGTFNSDHLDVGQGATGTLSVTNGASIHTISQFIVANAESGLAGSGTFNMNGGSVGVGSFFSIGAGGTSVGNFNLNGGTVTVGAEFNVGETESSKGIVNITDGILTAVSAFIGKASNTTGSVTQSGGLVNVTNVLNIGSSAGGTNGTYTLSGGTVTTAAIVTPNWSRLKFTSGTLNLNGGVSSNTGTLTIGNAGGLATLNQNGGAIYSSNETVGSGTSGVGIVNQNSGSNFVSVNLFIGSSGGGSGTYTLSAGLLSTVGSEFVGVGGNGVFVQNGGVNNNPSFLVIGDNGFSGRYDLNDGSVNANVEAIAASNSSGTLNQSGGTNTMSAMRVGGTGTMGIGIINLSGGKLTTGDLFLGGTGMVPGGVGILNATGGTLTASNGILVYNTARGTNISGVNLNGGTITAGFFTAPDWNRLNFVKGTLNLTGGVSSNTGTLTIGGGPGLATLNLSGGTLATSAVIDNGLFNQSGGISSLGVFSGTGSLIVGGVGTSLASAGSLVLPNVTVSTGGALNIGLATGLVSPVTISNSLTITNNANVTFIPTASAATASGVKTNFVKTLNIGSNGLLDLQNHFISVDNTATPFAKVKQYIDAAYNRNVGTGIGDYNGRGGITSAVVKANTDFMGVGYYDGALQDPANPDNVGQIYGPHRNDPTPAGIPLTQILIRPTLTGDLNGDGLVNTSDVTQFNSYGFFGSPTTLGYQAGDLNGDGKVNATDVTIFNSAGNFNNGTYLVAKAAKAATTLTGHSASPAVAELNPASSTLAFSYDPATGDVKVNYHGFTGFANKPTFNSGTRLLSLIDIASTGGIFALDSTKLAKAATDALSSPTITGNTEINLTAVNGFLPDGTDIGRILAPGLDPTQLANALTLTFNYTGSRNTSGGVAGLIVPEPATLSLLGFGALGLLARRRRHANAKGLIRS